MSDSSSPPLISPGCRIELTGVTPGGIGTVTLRPPAVGTNPGFLSRTGVDHIDSLLRQLAVGLGLDIILDMRGIAQHGLFYEIFVGVCNAFKQHPHPPQDQRVVTVTAANGTGHGVTVELRKLSGSKVWTPGAQSGERWYSYHNESLLLGGHRSGPVLTLSDIDVRSAAGPDMIQVDAASVGDGLYHSCRVSTAVTVHDARQSIPLSFPLALATGAAMRALWGMDAKVE